MSLQDSQTDAGIAPTRISCRKAKQPRQTPAKASRLAANISAPITPRANVVAPARDAARADTENTRPIPWANRFGGPGTNFGAMVSRRGRITLVTSNPSGENRGPYSTLAAKPVVSKAVTTGDPVNTNAAPCSTTPNPTSRADTSSTGLGNDGRGKRTTADDDTEETRLCRSVLSGCVPNRDLMHASVYGRRMALDHKLTRTTWRSLEAIHGMIYFTPDTTSAYEKVGVTHPRAGYFASRVAALGEASAELTIATFYNFNPRLIRKHIPGVWEKTSAAAMLGARMAAVDTSLRRAFSAEVLASPDFAEVVALNRRAAEATLDCCEGRPLFAAHAALPWPDDAHLQLWWSQTLLREFRGDGHIAALVCEGLTGLEALVTHAASGAVPASALLATRAWSAEQWQAAAEGLVTQGLLSEPGDVTVGTAPVFSDAGTAQRNRIEEVTDELSRAPYEVIGEVGCLRLRELGTPLSKAVVDAGLMVVDLNRYKQMQ
jgi:hypothetical protein